MTEVPDDPMGVLDRMTHILTAFDLDDRGLGLSELARYSGLPKSTVSRLVATLVKQHYLERDGRLIHLGLRVFELGQLARKPHELRALALPVMVHLRDQTGENVHLAIADDRETVCIAVLPGRHAAPHLRVGQRLPAHATASGKAVLAHLPAAMRREVLGGPLTAFTPHTITDEHAVQRQLSAIQAGALATEEREFDPNVSGSSAAVFDGDDRVCGAFGMSGLAREIDMARSAPSLISAARELTRRLASRGSTPGL